MNSGTTLPSHTVNRVILGHETQNLYRLSVIADHIWPLPQWPLPQWPNAQKTALSAPNLPGLFRLQRLPKIFHPLLQHV